MGRQKYYALRGKQSSVAILLYFPPGIEDRGSYALSLALSLP